jgi:uncharacterized protein (DUF58 family)
VPRPALLLALVLGALLGAATLLSPVVWVAVVAYHVVLLGVAVLDAQRLPRARGFIAERRLPRPLSLGAQQLVTIHLEHEDARGHWVEVADHVSQDLAPGARVLRGVLTRTSIDLAYPVRPPHRGAYRFGDIDVRCARPIGLWARQVRIPAAEVVAVYPNILAIREYELRLRRGMPIQSGVRRARPPGASTAFAGLRDYVRGDDARRISWTASARRDAPVTTVVEAERGQQVVIAIDCARLMTAPAGALSKLDHGVNSALLLAWVAQSQGDRVGLLTFADGVRDYLAPQRGPAQVSRINQRLYAVPAEYTEADFGAAFAYLSARLNRRSLVIVLTDVLDPEASSELVQHALRLAGRHLVLVVAMSDPEVLAARDRPVDSAARVYEWAAAEELLAARRRSFEILRRGGVLGLDVRAGELSVSLVERFLEMKERALL